MIRFEDVSYSYPGSNQVILENVSFTVKKGEFLGIIGRNGSGKSTLARMFNGILRPTKGKIWVEEMDTGTCRHHFDIRRKVGLLLPDPDNQIVSSIVEEDVAFGPGNLGLAQSEIRQRVDDALKLVEMEEFKKHPPYLLSGGQKQRIALAGVLALKPEYLVLDEPTAMIDPEGRHTICEFLYTLNKSLGITLIWITHDIEEITCADRIMIIEKGKLSEYGDVKQLLMQPEILSCAGIEPLAFSRFIHLLGIDKSAFNPDKFKAEELVDYLCQLKWRE